MTRVVVAMTSGIVARPIPWRDPGEGLPGTMAVLTLTDAEAEEMLRALLAWQVWEGRIMHAVVDGAYPPPATDASD